MSISLTTPVTGGTQTGFASPTYTIVSDTGPSAGSKQWAVTALGGTQASVRTHAPSDPFTVTYIKPATYKSNGKVNPVTGLLERVPKNVHKFIVRKGVIPLAGQQPETAVMTLQMAIPAGSDIADPANLRAAASLLVGALNALSAGMGDTWVTGVL